MPETNNGEVGGAYMHTNEGLLELIRNTPPYSPGSSLNLDDLFRTFHAIQRQREESTRLLELEARAMRFTRSWMDLQPHAPEYRAYLESIMPNNEPQDGQEVTAAPTPATRTRRTEDGLQRWEYSPTYPNGGWVAVDNDEIVPFDVPTQVPLPGRMANGDPIINTGGEPAPQPPGYYVAYQQTPRPPTPFGPNDPPAYFAGPPLRMTATQARQMDEINVDRNLRRVPLPGHMPNGDPTFPINPARTRHIDEIMMSDPRGVVGRVTEVTKRIVNFKFHESGWTEVEKDHAPEMIEDRSCIFDTGMDNVPEAFIKEDLACIKKAQPKITIVLCAAANRVFFRSDIYWPDIIEQAYAKKHKLSEHPKAQVSVDSAPVPDSGVGQHGNAGQRNLSGPWRFAEDGGQHETGRV